VNTAEMLEPPRRDLAAAELWRRSLARSRERRALAAAGEHAPRSLISAAILDLDGPAEYQRLALASERDLSDEELWDLSLACARARRLAAEKGFLPQARVASASLIVAAVAALAPTQGGAHPRASSAGAAQIDARLLKLGTRGSAVEAVQRALGISADGIFGPQTRAAVRAFQARKGLVVDGVVGPQTRAALFGQGAGGVELIRAWWVAPVQRALGVPVDGVYGPQTRAAIRAYQARHRLTVDGVVGPQTLGHLGIARPSSGHHHHGNDGGGGKSGHHHHDGSASGAQAEGQSGPASITRSLWDELALANRMGLRLISGHRPGATIGGGGGASDHAAYPSRAIDVAGSPAAMRGYALAVAGRAGIKYIIYSPLGMWGNWNGSWRPVHGGTRASHFSHVHVSASG
jgi:peptidoglycan hydrolase-like protein with peptidoglycan-binding domain